jgi:hypothetical protein
MRITSLMRFVTSMALYSKDTSLIIEHWNNVPVLIVAFGPKTSVLSFSIKTQKHSICCSLTKCWRSYSVKYRMLWQERRKSMRLEISEMRLSQELSAVQQTRALLQQARQQNLQVCITADCSKPLKSRKKAAGIMFIWSRTAIKT